MGHPVVDAFYGVVQKSGFTGQFFARLGTGEGLGAIKAPPSAGRRMVNYYRDTKTGRERGVARLSTFCGLRWRDSKSAEHRMILCGKLPGDSKIVYVLWIENFEGSDDTDLEQQLDQATVPLLRQLNTLRFLTTNSGVVRTDDERFYYFHPFTGKLMTANFPSVDLSDDISALTSGQHQLALISFDPDTGQLARTLNSAASASGSLPARNEMTEAKTLGITPPSFNIILGYVYLYYGQTEDSVPVIAEADCLRQFDPRQLFDVPREGVAYVQTTNNTATTLYSFTVSEKMAVTISGRIVAARDDLSASLHGTYTAGVRRASGGNVTLVGTPDKVLLEDSAGSPSYDIDVDTGTQTVRVRVTGITSQNWDWRTFPQITAVKF